MTGSSFFDLKYFKDLIQGRVGLTFDRTREEILRQKIAEAIVQRGCRSEADLYTALREDEGYFLEFVNHLTINETYFFREPQFLELLTGHLVPELLAGKKAGEKIKIISAGCSTGEEPYTIAIALSEKFAEKTNNLFSIVGADINSKALEKAEGGTYGKLSFRGSDELLQSKYFEPEGCGLFRIKASIRNLVQFIRFNLLSDDYPQLFCRADIVFYRNVSIYFDPPTQRKILIGLASIINEGGYVVFSASETYSHKDIGALSLVESKGLFYYKKISRRDGGTCSVSSPEIPRSGNVRRYMPGNFQELNSRRGCPKAPAPLPAALGKKSEICSSISQEVSASEDLFQEALVCFRKKEHDRALQLAERLHSCRRYRGKAYLLTGCVFLNRDKIREAGELFGKALQIDDLDLEAHLLLGLTAKNSGETVKAIECFSKALYFLDSCWMAHYFLAEIYLSIGVFKKALGYYGALLRIIENGSADKPNLTFFPISFKREDLLHLCRMKIASISETNHGI
ncbi:MAG: hypothetical protein HGB26_04340 [Desulfobulbaceae bacterium]|nr:hypothetical protein [Desulfobulbaceae bacterium]